MKFFGLLLLLLLGVLMQSALVTSSMDDEDEKEIEECKSCFESPYTQNLVCGVLKGIYATYWNQCELKCAGASFAHEDQCTYEELLENRYTFHNK